MVALYRRENPPNGSVECKGVWKNRDFRPISRSISETVIVRWAHAARQFVSIEFSFHPYNIQVTIEHIQVTLKSWPRSGFQSGLPECHHCIRNLVFWSFSQRSPSILLLLIWASRKGRSTGACTEETRRGQSNLTKSASRGAHSPLRGHPRGSKVVPLNSWGRVSY